MTLVLSSAVIPTNSCGGVDHAAPASSVPHPVHEQNRGDTRGIIGNGLTHLAVLGRRTSRVVCSIQKINIIMYKRKLLLF